MSIGLPYQNPNGVTHLNVLFLVMTVSIVDEVAA